MFRSRKCNRSRVMGNLDGSGGGVGIFIGYILSGIRRHANVRRDSDISPEDGFAVAEASAARKSTNPVDYQHVPRPVAAMAKQFRDGHVIDTHAHERDQFLYAVSGIMRVRTLAEAWIVPPDRAVYVPAGLPHSVAMRGPVDMRTLYIDPDARADLPRRALVLEVGDLMRALVLALIEEPVLYDEAGRGGDIARLVLSEIVTAEALHFVIPMPQARTGDKRLERLCTGLLDDPADQRTLDIWAEDVGASARTLARLFQKSLGMSFNVWRQRVRFHNAIEGLTRGEPIADIAAANGYRSTSAFTAAFRKSVGVPPSAFRPSGQPAV